MAGYPATGAGGLSFRDAHGCGARSASGNPAALLVFPGNPERSPLDDPTLADGFDLALEGLTRARFGRVTDRGANRFSGPPGGRLRFSTRWR